MLANRWLINFRTPGSIPTVHCCVLGLRLQPQRPTERVWRPVLPGWPGGVALVLLQGLEAGSALPRPASFAGPRQAEE